MKTLTRPTSRADIKVSAGPCGPATKGGTRLHPGRRAQSDESDSRKDGNDAEYHEDSTDDAEDRAEQPADLTARARHEECGREQEAAHGEEPDPGEDHEDPEDQDPDGRLWRRRCRRHRHRHASRRLGFHGMTEGESR